MADVFISHAPEDGARAAAIAEALQALGLDVQRSGKDGGPGSLPAAKAILVAWSAAAVTSTRVREEATHGLARGVLAAVTLEPCEPPPAFRAIPAEDLSDWPSPEAHPGFERLVGVLAQLKNRPAPAAAAGPRVQAVAALPPKKPRWGLMIGAGAALAAALVAGLQVSGRLAPPEAPSETVAYAGAAQQYGLTNQQIGSLDSGALLDAAFVTSSFETISAEAVEGDPLGQALLCLAYDRGQGVAPDPVAARTWCERGAAAGNPIATHQMSRAYRAGLYGIAIDEAEANRLLAAAADAGDARAQYELALAAVEGQNGVPQDDSRALAAARAAADQGYPSAQFLLGWMYENGRGVAQDYATALLWYKKLADEGLPSGKRAVGWMHQNGFGAQKDLAKAAALYAEASALGDGNASHNLAALYEEGSGVEKNLDEAVRLYRLADAQGYAPSRAKLEALGGLE